MDNLRLVLYHQQPTSGRTLFLRLDGTVCQFGGLPDQSQVIDRPLGDDANISPAAEPALTALVAQTEQRLGLTQGAIALDHQFEADVTTPESSQPIEVYLAKFTSIDAPYEAVSGADGKLIAITESRSLGATEVQVLKRVYSFLLDG